MRVFTADMMKRSWKYSVISYCDGLSPQLGWDYAEASGQYYEVASIEKCSSIRPFVLCYGGLVYAGSKKFTKELEYCHRVLELQSQLPLEVDKFTVSKKEYRKYSKVSKCCQVYV